MQERAMKTWSEILNDPTLNRLVHRINRKFPWMSEENLEYVVKEFETARRILNERGKKS